MTLPSRSSGGQAPVLFQIGAAKTDEIQCSFPASSTTTVTTRLMRDSLVSQHAIIRRLRWYHPSSTRAQQRVSRKAPIEGGPTRGHVDSKPDLPTATTVVGLPSDSSTTIEDLRGPPLPLSPLLDPDLLAARNRYKLPKPEPGRELSAFQKKLRNNPYGTTASDIYPTVLPLNGLQLKLLLHPFGNAPLLLLDSPSSSS